MYSAKAKIVLMVPAQAVARGRGCVPMGRRRVGFNPHGPFGFGPREDGFGPREDALFRQCDPCKDVLVPSRGSGGPLQGDAVAEGTAHGGSSSLCPLCGATEAGGAPRWCLRCWDAKPGWEDVATEVSPCAFILQLKSWR